MIRTLEVRRGAELEGTGVVLYSDTPIPIWSFDLTMRLCLEKGLKEIICVKLYQQGDNLF